ncbi:MAG: DEAD/DEAH box helicase [candidate division KSB1 bacterium]|nr:DEAD/DEAH box helicase [candidate division KSB1 bacterium]
MNLTLEQILEQLKRDRDFTDHVTQWKTIPAQAASYSEFPKHLDAALIDTLKERGINKLYTHQATAIQSVFQGKNLVIVTPTASGKTLCYNLPVLQSILETHESRALYLFPTKALSQDQLTELHEILHAVNRDIDFSIKSYTFDGDTPVSARKAIKSSGHIVVTNPDMLHTGILPHHTQWIKLFENLKYIVIDEIHHYRGLFGSHLANVVRRLKRICMFYGSQPTFICCSATIANPRQLCEKITGETMTLVDNNGAPRGEKHFILYNPPMVNRELGIRRSYVKESTRIASRFLTNNHQTIVFARSRMNVEIMLTYLKEAMRKSHQNPGKVKGYRGGYLPLERRSIEQGLRSKEIIGVISTNALELGIDIGQLQVSIIAGYPGTIASTLQQSGRAGRGSETALSIIVSSSSPLDQYIANNPTWFFENSPEAGIVDPDNLVILLSHIKCAAFELPFSQSEQYGIHFNGENGLSSTPDILEYLEEKHIIHFSGEKWHWMAETYPAESVSLRSAAQENVVIVDRTRKERVIGEIDLFAAQLMVHDEAIYLHGGEQYYVDKLDWQRRKAYTHQVKVDHYTDAQLKTNLRVLDVSEQNQQETHLAAYGEVVVTSVATMYKKIKFNTHENIGWGKIHLPEIEIHTQSFWYSFPEDIHDHLGIDKQSLADGLKGVTNVMRNIIPIFIMGDRRDFDSLPMVRSPLSGQPSFFIWEHYPGGVGYSKKIYSIYPDIANAAKSHITQCGCESGCPSCVGPVLQVGEQGKTIAGILLEYIVKVEL